MARPKLAGRWIMKDGEDISWEIRVYPKGSELVVLDDSEPMTTNEIVVACGLDELERTIRILESAKQKMMALPKAQQESPPFEGDEEEEEEEEEEEADEPEESANP